MRNKLNLYFMSSPMDEDTEYLQGILKHYWSRIKEEYEKNEQQ